MIVGEGRGLLEHIRNTHVLQQRFGFSLIEINNMVPWELDVRMQLILADQEAEKASTKKQ